jgi:NTP pyrophosphatase (non-canonical NTP hydrolase)
MNVEPKQPIYLNLVDIYKDIEHQLCMIEAEGKSLEGETIEIPATHAATLQNVVIDFGRYLSEVPKSLNEWAREQHEASAQWWHDLETGERLNRNKGELLMLIVSEIAEAMEGERKNLMDDKLPHRRMVEVELADALIRIFDYAGAYNLDLEGAVREKQAYNATRADHKAENRKLANGKKW